MIYKNDESGLCISISDYVLQQIFTRAISNYDLETGGMLVGRYIDNNKCALIEKTIIPTHEKSSKTGYVRDTNGMEGQWRLLEEDGLEYIGEWHSHPNGSSKYSQTDFDAMKEISEDSNVRIANPLLMIVSLSQNGIKGHSFYALRNSKLIKFRGMVNLPDLFAELQTQMQSALNLNRNAIGHYPSMGDATETHWINFLNKYLPNRYKVDKAMVIDHTGDVSDQIDIVIYDALYTPFIFNHDGFKYIPAEGVYAVFEVKQDIKGNIDYAAKKIESVRRLQRTSMKMVASGRTHKERALSKIIGGILTTSTSIHDDTIESNLKELQGFQTIDLGCCVDGGSFYVEYEGTDSIDPEHPGYENYRKFYEGRQLTKVHFNKKGNSLFIFFLQLVQYLKQIGTVPAIDINAYLNTLGEKIDITF